MKLIFFLTIILYACNLPPSRKIQDREIKLFDTSFVKSDTTKKIDRPRLTYMEVPQEYYDQKSSYQIDPIFPGGDSGLHAFIGNNIRIPNEVKGKMFSLTARVKVETNGKAKLVSFIELNSCDDCKNAVKELLNIFPYFKPSIYVDNVNKIQKKTATYLDIRFDFFTTEERDDTMKN